MTERSRIDTLRNEKNPVRSDSPTRLPPRETPAAPPAQAPGAGKGGMPTQDGLIAQVRDLPALSNVVLSVMEMTRREDCSAREIAQEISKDPHFAARILKLANSAFYGLSRSVATISEAVTLLGNRTLRRLAIVAATQDSLRRPVSGYDLEAGALWQHSVACGLAAQMLAETARYPRPEEAFVAGLLHDIGKVVIGLYVEGAIDAIRLRMEADDCTFLEAERAELGFDHAEIGGRIALHWNLPAQTAQAIALQYQPVQNGQVVPLAALVHVANALSLTAGMGLGADGLRTSVSSPALESLQLDETKMETILDRLVGRFAEMKSLFEMEGAA